MIDRSDPRLVNRLRIFVSASAVFTVVTGLSALAGWKLHIAALETWIAAPIRIVPNAAACLLLLGVSLWLQRTETETKTNEDRQSFQEIRQFAGQSAAAVVCLVGLLTLAEHVWGWDFRLDRLLVVVPAAETIPGARPGLMATITALNLLLLGPALLLLNWKPRRADWPSQFLALGTAILSAFSLSALLLQPTASGIMMALPTALTFFVLACGLLCARPGWALNGLLVRQSAGARLFRKALPAALLVLSLIGWSISKALLSEAHFTSVEAGLLAILCGALLVGFTWIAFIVDRSDALNAKLEQRVAERTAALQSEVSERTLAQQALKESLITKEAALKDLADQKFALDQHSIVAVTDLAGTITSVNDKFCAISQYSREELIGRNHRIVNSGYHSKEFFQHMYHTIGDSQVWHGEIRNRAKDGSIYWLDATIVPLLDENGRPRQYIAIRTDITERKLAEEIRERLAAVVEGSNDAIISKTLDGTITAWNSGAERLFGYTAAEAVGRPVCMLFPPELAPEESGILARIARGQRVESFETVRLRKDGTRVDVSATISPIRNSSGEIVGASKIARDITGRKQAEKRLAGQAEELARSNADLEQFAYVASHDLQEPLRMVAAYTQLLAERYRGQLDQNADKFIGYACEGALRMQAVIQDLLSFSRVGRAEFAPQEVNCDAAIEEVLLILGPAIRESGAVITRSSLPVVWADHSQMVQVFQNLIGNAIKFRGKEAPKISAHAERSGAQWLFSIADNGIGIAPEQAEQIFVVFQRLHSRTEYPGNGIGLAICKKIIERSGGRIWVESLPTQGSVFKFTLPAESVAKPEPIAAKASTHGH